MSQRSPITTHSPRSVAIAAAVLLCALPAFSDDGYRLWLKYDRVGDAALLRHYRRQIVSVSIPGNSPTMRAVRRELTEGLHGMLGTQVPVVTSGGARRQIVIASRRRSRVSSSDTVTPPAGRESYAIRSIVRSGATVIAANEDIGLLYGAFHFLRLLETHTSIESLAIASQPAIGFRILDHWDNLDGVVERGYAGASLWKWDRLPEGITPRDTDYARANASLGINGVTLNNVNAAPTILTADYLRKTAALAGVFRPFGIRVFLSVNFASPLAPGTSGKGGIGTLATADPLDPAVRAWWKTKVDEIYALIPDFGGFLVKANSEGMPGPQDYGRTHADGANLLADALGPHGGIVMWRGFVYNADVDADRVKRAYAEFAPLDGRFRLNVFVQLKNGPLDFQPREPVQPLFGAMPKTPLMLELQVTQEYLGHSTHLVFLAPMWKEYLTFDTFASGPGTTLASVIDGSSSGYPMTGIAGVANTGDDRNWCGHLFAQANWFAFGRLAWNPALPAEAIATDWIRMSLTHDEAAIATIRSMMMGSWEACVSYMTPLGLHHIMQEGFHYGPGPAHGEGREDWRSTYYHRADSFGLGYDRSSAGSNAAAQYPLQLCSLFDDVATCPEKYLLWFHHVGWGHTLRSGRTLWEELCAKYFAGTAAVDTMARAWASVQGAVDSEIFSHVRAKLEQQRTDAAIWRDTCLAYFQKFSRRTIAPPGTGGSGR